MDTPNSPKPLAGWLAGIVFVVLSLIWVVLVNLGAAILAVALVLLDGGELSQQSITERLIHPLILGFMTCLQTLGLLGIAAAIATRRGPSLRQAFSLRKSGPGPLVGGLIVGGSIGVFAGWVAQVLARLIPALDSGHFDLIETVLTEGSIASRLPIFFAVVVVAPLAEELIFRGVLWGLIEDCFPSAGDGRENPIGRHFAWIGTSVLFALYHLDPLHSLAVFSTGLFIGWLRLRSRSIYPGMLAHFVNNALGLALIFLVPSDTEMTAVVAFAGLAVALLGLGIALLGSRRAGAGSSAQGAR